jgi:(4S)-4-hydroxy-5-phosphonooxypentane-2,3-dione isomerase
MHVVCVTIVVKPGHEEEFIRATEANHRGTRQEPGNVRFDVLQREEDPSLFLLYEVYRDKEAFAVHQKTPHYLTWRQTVADWMAVPRQGVKHRSLLPTDDQF